MTSCCGQCIMMVFTYIMPLLFHSEFYVSYMTPVGYHPIYQKISECLGNLIKPVIMLEISHNALIIGCSNDA